MLLRQNKSNALHQDHFDFFFLLYSARNKWFLPHDNTELVIPTFHVPWNALYHSSSFFFVQAILLAPCNPVACNSISYRDARFPKFPKNWHSEIFNKYETLFYLWVLLFKEKRNKGLRLIISKSSQACCLFLMIV